MRLIILIILLFPQVLIGQDYYAKAKNCFDKNQLDSARIYINHHLSKKTNADAYFLSGMLYAAEGKSIRALADFEAAVKLDPNNFDAYFKKALIYYNSSSNEKAISDFTYVIENGDGMETRAIYYINDPFETKGTTLGSLQSMFGWVHQYRGLAYQKIGETSKAQADFNKSFAFDTVPDFYINRSQFYMSLGKTSEALEDLYQAINLDSTNYTAWYNLVLLDASVEIPTEFIHSESFAPLLNLMGANAFEEGLIEKSIEYYSKTLQIHPDNEFALIGRGKSFLKLREYDKSRIDFLKVIQLNPTISEAFLLIGNSFFYQEKFLEAIGFYEQYLSLDRGYANAWYNASMSYFSIKNEAKGCVYLDKAIDLGMQSAIEMRRKYCGG